MWLVVSIEALPTCLPTCLLLVIMNLCSYSRNRSSFEQYSVQWYTYLPSPTVRRYNIRYGCPSDVPDFWTNLASTSELFRMLEKGSWTWHLLYAAFGNIYIHFYFYGSSRRNSLCSLITKSRNHAVPHGPCTAHIRATTLSMTSWRHFWTGSLMTPLSSRFETRSYLQNCYRKVFPPRRLQWKQALITIVSKQQP